jgi:hypothetical protein
LRFNTPEIQAFKNPITGLYNPGYTPYESFSVVASVHPSL